MKIERLTERYSFITNRVTYYLNGKKITRKKYKEMSGYVANNDVKVIKPLSKPML